MASTTRPLTSFRLLCFDCFGTLIDQEAGVYTGLEPLLARVPATHQQPRDAVLARFQAHEGAVQAAQPTLAQSGVLAGAYRRLGAELGVGDVSGDEAAAFGARMGGWPAFADTVAALQRLARRYKLVVLSNVDRATWEGTMATGLAGARFDAVYTAQDIGSYKPDRRNFEYMLGRVGEEFGVATAEVLQTAQSLRHDHEPAKAVGVASAWIDRYHQQGAGMGGALAAFEGKVDLMYRFETLGEMAEAVEKAFAAEGK